MSEPKRYVYPMTILPWSSLETADGVKLSPSEKMKAVGYIPVYDSLPALEEDHGSEVRHGTFVADNRRKGTDDE